MFKVEATASVQLVDRQHIELDLNFIYQIHSCPLDSEPGVGAPWKCFVYWLRECTPDNPTTIICSFNEKKKLISAWHAWKRRPMVEE